MHVYVGVGRRDGYKKANFSTTEEIFFYLELSNRKSFFENTAPPKALECRLVLKNTTSVDTLSWV